MNKKWFQNPILVLLSCIVVFPIGLVLLGANSSIRWGSKLLISLTYIVLILVFFIYYQPVLKTPKSSSISASMEKIEYQIGQCYSQDSLQNGLSVDTLPSKEESFFCVDLEVINQGQTKVFYVSLIDDPKLITEKAEYSPDLSLSQEPFGEMIPNQPYRGYLAFRIPKGEKILRFRIGKSAKNISP